MRQVIPNIQHKASPLFEKQKQNKNKQTKQYSRTHSKIIIQIVFQITTLSIFIEALVPLR